MSNPRAGAHRDYNLGPTEKSMGRVGESGVSERCSAVTTMPSQIDQAETWRVQYLRLLRCLCDFHRRVDAASAGLP